MTPQFLIALGYATAQQRDAIQAKLKDHANGWWHHLPDTWIAGGKTHKEWADLLRPEVEGTTARLLVVQLPSDQNERMFAVRGAMPKRASEWLWQSYYGKPYPSG